jgi:glycolate oxidase
MLDDSAIEALQAIAGEKHVLTHKVDLVTYSFDATADVPRRIPGVVVMPANTEEVRSIVNLARTRGIAIYPRGAGTNLSGCAIPLKRGIVLSFQRMNRILEVDPENLTATVQPGVVIQELNNAVAGHGLIYPPDPGTVATATMGGSGCAA